MTQAQRYAVLGHPVHHSQSPWIHQQFARQTQQLMHYEAIELPLDGFVQGLHDLHAQGLQGCNVTVPFKHQAFARVQHTTPRATLAQACNTLWFEGPELHGDNTDGEGLMRDLQAHLPGPWPALRVLLVGAGGASAGVLGPLLEQGPQAVQVVNRTAERAHQLCQRHAALAQQLGVALSAGALHEHAADFDVVINASASSLAAAAVPLQPHALRPGALAVDLMYGSAALPFMQWAQRHQASARDGLGMLVQQAALSFQRWRGVAPDVAPVLQQLRQRLA
ncbi:MAG: shikimate dehydrogenase [Burkholderiaceae bacterium]|jgi:shikimate dehydrogenase